MNAVYAFADSLQRLENDTCPDSYDSSKCLKQFEKHYNDFFKKYLSQVELNSSRLFDENGDLAQPKYAIYQFQADIKGEKRYIKVGNWGAKSGVHFEIHKLVWPLQFKDLQNTLPTSLCSKACSPGHILKSRGGVCCSGSCEACKEYEYVYETYTCKDCNEYGNDTIGWWPNPDKTDCLPPSQDLFTPISMFLFMWGITLTSIILITFIRHRDTPIVKNSSKEHCIVVLVGLFLLFLNAPIVETSPNQVVCVLFRYIAPVGLSMVYSALLVKLNRLYRIFDLKLKAKKTKKNTKARKSIKPNYVSVYSTLCITAGLVGVQLLITTLLIAYDPTDSIPVYPERQNDTLKKCKYPGMTLAISHLYNLFLIFSCTYYAVKTRHLPENFKETKVIGFAMYSTCILWLLSIPLYFGVQYQHYHIKVHLYALSVSVSGFIILVCIFIPKAFIILCKPEKNTPEHMYINDCGNGTYKFSRKLASENPTEGFPNQNVCSKCNKKVEEDN